MSTNDTQPDDAEEISREEADEIIDEIERRRSLQGLAALAVAVIGICFSLFQLALAARSFTFTIPLPTVDLGLFAVRPIQISLQLLQANAVHVGFALVLTFLMFPATMGDGPFSRRL
ncbi:TRAP transporter permease, partial [Halorubrum sp. SP3]